MATKTEEAVKSLLLRELGRLSYREKTHLKSFVDKKFVSEMLAEMARRKFYWRWLRALLWLGFVALMFSFVRLTVPSNPTYLAMSAIVIYALDTAVAAQVEAIRRRELIYRALRRFAFTDAETINVEDESD